MGKYVLWFGFITVLISLMLGSQWPKNGLSLTVCNVGQGDGIVITEGFSQLVVDTGPPDETMLACLGKVLPFWDRNIETIVLSHADSDHSGGLENVMRHYRVKQIIVNAATASKIYSITPKSTKIIISGQGDRWQFGNALGEVIWPPKQTHETNSNESSLVWRMEYRHHSVLFEGDADEKVETEIAAEGLIQPTEYLKVSHHGSNTATSSRFLGILQPHQAIISVGYPNKYGHPHRETLLRLENQGTKITRTDQQGTVTIHFN